MKAGKSRNRAQRYRCKQCMKYQLLAYQKKAYTSDTEGLVSIYLEGCGIRSLGRIYGISPGTVLNRIRSAARDSELRSVFKPGLCYEMDELHANVGRKGKEVYISYAMERDSRQVVDFVVGRRTKESISKVVEKVLSFMPDRVYTDGLNIYPSMLPKHLHKVSRFMTNGIERYNLTLRTHLKRLSRKTICFSRSVEMLEASLRLYFNRRVVNAHRSKV